MALLARVSPQLWLNVLSQYQPAHEAKLVPLVARRPRADEVATAVQAARQAGLLRVHLDGRPV